MRLFIIELTARPWVGVHRYTYVNDTGPKAVVFPITDAISVAACAGANITIDTENYLVYGSMLYSFFHVLWSLVHRLTQPFRNMGSLSQRFGGFTTHFVARFHAPFSKYGVWKGVNVLVLPTAKILHITLKKYH